MDDKDSDFDFDDLDDDLGDESWDEFDDEDMDDSDSEASGTNSGEKTFVQKYFYVIVGAVILAGLGIVVLGQSITGTSQPQNNTAGVLPVAENDQNEASVDTAIPESTNQLGAIEIDQDGNILPMPTPIETVSAENSQPIAALADIEFDLEDQPQEDALPTNDSDVLTPMPELSDSDSLIDDSQNNDIEVAEIPAEEPQNNLDILSDVLDNYEDVKETADETIDDIEESFTLDIEAEEETNTAPVSEVVPEPAPAPQEEASVTTTASVISNEAEQQITALEQKIETISDTLTTQISKNEQKIDELIALIGSLKDDIKQGNTTAPKSTPRKEPAPEAAKPAKQEPKTAAKPKPAPQKQVNWSLRSAQPGKALVSKENSNDMISIEVGQYLPNVGKITSIQPENGRWVVRGTKGTIQQ